MSDDEFLAQFENCTLPFDQWTHRAHVRVAYLYLRRHPFREALPDPARNPARTTMRTTSSRADQRLQRDHDTRVSGARGRHDGSIQRNDPHARCRQFL